MREKKEKRRSYFGLLSSLWRGEISTKDMKSLLLKVGGLVIFCSVALLVNLFYERAQTSSGMLNHDLYWVAMGTFLISGILAILAGRALVINRSAATILGMAMSVCFVAACFFYSMAMVFGREINVSMSFQIFGFLVLLIADLFFATPFVFAFVYFRRMKISADS